MGHPSHSKCYPRFVRDRLLFRSSTLLGQQSWTLLVLCSISSLYGSYFELFRMQLITLVWRLSFEWEQRLVQEQACLSFSVDHEPQKNLQSFKWITWPSGYVMDILNFAKNCCFTFWKTPSTSKYQSWEITGIASSIIGIATMYNLDLKLSIYQTLYSSQRLPTCSRDFSQVSNTSEKRTLNILFPFIRFFNCFEFNRAYYC